MNPPDQRRFEPGATRRQLLFALAAAVAGVLLSSMSAPDIFAFLPREPVWLAPAIVAGTLAVCLVLLLLVPLSLRHRSRR